MQQPDTDFEAPVARTIALGMRQVAQADGGGIHQREMALISAFEGEIPADVEPAPASALAAEDLRDTYLRSLVMVALADGVISEPERAVIAERALAVGLDESGLSSLIKDVKLDFLRTFRNVKVFKDSVGEISAALGVSLDELD